MNCTVCNRNMTTAKGDSAIGVSIQIRAISLGGNEILQELYPELAPDFEANVCYVCWLKSLGVRIETTLQLQVELMNKA